jgi:hypothetical protein
LAIHLAFQLPFIGGQVSFFTYTFCILNQFKVIEVFINKRQILAQYACVMILLLVELIVSILDKKTQGGALFAM